MLGELEDLAVIGAHALEHGAAIVQRMGKKMHLCVGPRDQLAIEPDNAFALIELAKVAIRGVFAARYESLRLLRIPDSVAAWWSVRLRWFVSVIGYGLLVVVPIVNVQLSYFLGAAVSFLLMGGAYIYALSVIFKNRRLFTERLMRMADNASVGFFAVLYRVF